MREFYEQLRAELLTAWRGNIWLTLVAAVATAFGVFSFAVSGSFVPFIIITVVLVATKQWPYAAMPIGFYGLLAVFGTVTELFGFRDELDAVRPLLLLMLLVIVTLARRFIPILLAAAGLTVLWLVVLAVLGLLTTPVFPSVNGTLLYLALALFALAAVWKVREPLRKLSGEFGKRASREQLDEVQKYVRTQWPGLAVAALAPLALIYDRLIWSSSGFRIQEPTWFGPPIQPDQLVYGALLVALAVVFAGFMPDDEDEPEASSESEQPDPTVTDELTTELYEHDKHKQAVVMPDLSGWVPAALKELEIGIDELDEAEITPVSYAGYAISKAIEEAWAAGLPRLNGVIPRKKLEDQKEHGFRVNFFDDYGITDEMVRFGKSDSKTEPDSATAESKPEVVV